MEKGTIYICGDVHRNIDYAKIPRFAKDNQCSSNDYLIVAGDLGALWFGDSRDNEFINKMLRDFKGTVLWVDGNHENFDALRKYEIMEWNGGLVHKIKDRFLHLMRGQVFTIAGKTFFTCGGAHSADKDMRVLGRDWWRQEVLTFKDMDTAYENLEKVNWKVDYIITHCIHKKIISKFIHSSWVWRDPCSFNLFFEQIESKTQFKKWFFGHYHEDVTIEDKFTCLYNEVVKLD